MTPQQVQNLSTLIRFMEKLEAPDFTMAFYSYGCGTPACAYGWASTIPEFAAQGVSMGSTAEQSEWRPDVATRLFGDYNGLFSSDLRHIKTPQEWAEHARAFLKAKGHEVLSQCAPANDFPRFMERVLKPVKEATPDFCGYVERFPRV